MKSHQIGIDLGGTKIEAVCLDPSDDPVHRERIPTPRGGQEEYRDILEATAGLARDALRRLPPETACTIGVGIPGTLHGKDGTVRNANTTALADKPFRQDLEQLLGRPVGLENDANCFTLAEALKGAGRGFRVVFGIILGTGCGGGICIDGRLFRGKHRIAGEWGHFSVDPAGASCWCGNRGCIETKISGTGVADAYRRRFGESLSFEEIVRRSRRNDPACGDIFERFLDDFGRCVAGLITILDPDALVIGGGLSKVDELYAEGVDRVRRHLFQHRITPTILKNELGDSAGVYGAAWIGR